ncbi:hypothetical protein [Cryomorpha ignava]|nr:hypothetical protein [Cryomorpha ignava]
MKAVFLLFYDFPGSDYYPLSGFELPQGGYLAEHVGAKQFYA